MFEPPAPPIDIPPAELSPAALQGVIEAFVLKEGTDYGQREFTLQEKVWQVQRQLARGEARILYYPDTEVVEIVKV